MYARADEVGFDQANRVLDPVAVDRQWAAVAHFDGRRGAGGQTVMLLID